MEIFGYQVLKPAAGPGFKVLQITLQVLMAKLSPKGLIIS